MLEERSWHQRHDIAERGRRWLAAEIARCEAEYSGDDALAESEIDMLTWLSQDADARGVVRGPVGVLGRRAGNYTASQARVLLQWLEWRGSVTVAGMPPREGQKVPPVRIDLAGWDQA